MWNKVPTLGRWDSTGEKRSIEECLVRWDCVDTFCCSLVVGWPRMRLTPWYFTCVDVVTSVALFEAKMRRSSFFSDTSERMFHEKNGGMGMGMGILSTLPVPVVYSLSRGPSTVKMRRRKIRRARIYVRHSRKHLDKSSVHNNISWSQSAGTAYAHAILVIIIVQYHTLSMLFRLHERRSRHGKWSMARSIAR